MLPVNEFIDIPRVLRFLQLESPWRKFRLPLSLFPSTYRPVRLRIFPNVVGIDPVKVLSVRSRVPMLDILPMDSGMVPVRRFVEKLKLLRFLR